MVRPGVPTPMFNNSTMTTSASGFSILMAAASVVSIRIGNQVVVGVAPVALLPMNPVAAAAVAVQEAVAGMVDHLR